MMDTLTWQGCLVVVGLILIVRLFLLDRPYQTIEYYIKKFTFGAGLITATFVYVPFFCLDPCSVKNGWYIWDCMKKVGSLLNITWEVRRSRNKRRANDRQCVIVANHQSTLDVIGMGVVFNALEFVLVAKRELFFMWPIGLSAWLCGMVFIDRNNPKQANDILDKNASKIFKEKKTNIWFFPEGVRNKNNRTFLPFKKGAFRVAVSCQVPIQPIVFSPHYFLDEVRHVCEPGKVIATFLPLISTEGLTMDDVDELTEKTRNLMLKTYEDSYKELLSDKELTIGYNKLAVI